MNNQARIVMLMITLLISVVLATPSLATEPLTLLRQETIADIRQIDPNFYQERIPEDNPRYDCVVLISKANRSIELALLDEEQNVLWRRPARSSRVIVAAEAPRIVILGQTENDGFAPGLRKTIFQGLDAYNFSGDLMYRLDDTGPIGQVVLSSEGQLLLSTAVEIRLYDIDGKLVWKKSSPPAEASFLGEGKHIKIFQWDVAADIFTLQLWDASDGEVLKQWQYHRSHEMSILSVWLEKQRLLMSEYGKSVPAEWDLVLYDTDTWKPVTTLSRLPAGPFSPIWNDRENNIVFLLRRPKMMAAGNPSEILLGLWDLDGGSLVTQTLGEHDIDFQHDGMSFDDQLNQYVVRIGSTMYIYGRQ